MKLPMLIVALMLSFWLASAQAVTPPGPFGQGCSAGPTTPYMTGNGGMLDFTQVPPTIYGTNVNGVLNPLAFPGVDLGAQINAAIASSPGGTIIQIPAGIYNVATTIQCPIATTGSGQPTFIFQGAGMQSPVAQTQSIPIGTIINYTGNGDLFNQVEPGAMSQNATGCKLRDMTLNGGTAGPNAIGYHFGGTDDAEVTNVKIELFAKAGIEIDNTNHVWTERWRLAGTTALEYNGIGVWTHCPAGTCNASFEHSYMNVWLNVGTGETGVLMDGASNNVNSDWELNGNIDNSTNGTPPSGTPPGGTLLKLTTGAWFAATLTDKTECQASGCTRFNVDSASGWQGGLTPGTNGGPFTDTLAAGSIFYPAYNISYAGLQTLGHIGSNSSTHPTLTACGTGPTIDPRSSDTIGTFTLGTGASGCTINFWHAFNGPTLPACTITSSGQPVLWFVQNITDPAVAFTCYNLTGTPCSGAYSAIYHCMGMGGL
jgi:hypothetical protein